jgi:hypothetical protein
VKASHILAAMLAASAPMTAGMPPLDSGRREPRLGPRVVVEGPPPPRTSEADRAALDRAAAKRARRAQRGW